jgi:hypothetical protein
MRLELGRFHKAGVTDHIGNENGPEAPLELWQRFNQWISVRLHRDPSPPSQRRRWQF